MTTSSRHPRLAEDLLGRCALGRRWRARTVEAWLVAVGVRGVEEVELTLHRVSDEGDGVVLGRRHAERRRPEADR
jgi:hypothetical protein